MPYQSVAFFGIIDGDVVPSITLFKALLLHFNITTTNIHRLVLLLHLGDLNGLHLPTQCGPNARPARMSKQAGRP
eukprot:9485400-Pyramimonas_sp.AAC.1